VPADDLAFGYPLFADARMKAGHDWLRLPARGSSSAACGKAAGWLEDIARTRDGRRVKTCEDCTDCLPAA
jgi:hypothetical protein